MISRWFGDRAAQLSLQEPEPCKQQHCQGAEPSSDEHVGSGGPIHCQVHQPLRYRDSNQAISAPRQITDGLTIHRYSPCRVAPYPENQKSRVTDRSSNAKMLRIAGVWSQGIDRLTTQLHGLPKRKPLIEFGAVVGRFVGHFA